MSAIPQVARALDVDGCPLFWGSEVTDLTNPKRGVASVKRTFMDGKVTIHYHHSNITVRRVKSTDLKKV